MIIGGLLPLGMLGMSGHFGMMSEMDTGEMMGEMIERESGMMPLQSFLWASVTRHYTNYSKTCYQSGC